MENLDFTGLHQDVAAKLSPILEIILAVRRDATHSIHVTGSAVMADYDPKISDINTVLVLRAMDLGFIEFLAPLGKKFGKKGIAAPLILTPESIRDSLDSFPVEFLDFKLMHRTVYGPDVFRDLSIGRRYLRLQCEREIKTRLMGLRQGYLSSMGTRELLSALLIRSFTGVMALFRAMLVLLDQNPPLPRAEVIELLKTTQIPTEGFVTLLRMKSGDRQPSETELRLLFEKCYHSLEGARKIIDELPC